MADDRSKRGPADSTRVNMKEAYEVRYWTEKFGCTETQLRAAVTAVGVLATDVQAFLKKK